MASRFDVTIVPLFAQITDVNLGQAHSVFLREHHLLIFSLELTKSSKFAIQ